MTGRFVLLHCGFLHPESDGTYTMGPQHLYRFDRRRDRLVRATPPSETGDDPMTGASAMSGDGRYVTWCSVDSYGRSDEPGSYDLFVADLRRDVWRRVAYEDHFEAGPHCDTSVAEGARVVAFTSRTAYSSRDSNESNDVYSVGRPLAGA